MNSKLKVHNRERFNKGLSLVKSTLYNKPIYWSQMLSNEEVQRKLDEYYGGKLTIFNFRGTKRHAVLHCKECGEFKTKGISSSYIYGKFKDCEKCTEKIRLKQYNELCTIPNTRVVDYYYDVDCTAVVLVLYCDNCGLSRNLAMTSIDKIYSCSKCNELNISSNYKIELKAVGNGKVLINYINNRNIKTFHFLCGTSSSTSKENSFKCSCGKCMHKISLGKPKPHNQHLVKEYLTILYNVKTLKDFLVEHNQLDNLPQSEAKTILEHIDGWIKNYEEIVNKYPNGDLGTVLENNPLYKKCKEVFYPLLKRYNLKIEGDGVIE